MTLRQTRRVVPIVREIALVPQAGRRWPADSKISVTVIVERIGGLASESAVRLPPCRAGVCLAMAIRASDFGA
jgi:hypothetical protein